MYCVINCTVCLCAWWAGAKGDFLESVMNPIFFRPSSIRRAQTSTDYYLYCTVVAFQVSLGSDITERGPSQVCIIGSRNAPRLPANYRHAGSSSRQALPSAMLCTRKCCWGSHSQVLADVRTLAPASSTHLVLYPYCNQVVVHPGSHCWPHECMHTLASCES